MDLRCLAALARDDRGVSTVEFAMFSTLILSVLLVGLDFGKYTLDSAELSTAVEQAAMIALDQGSTDSIDTTAIAAYVTGTAGLATTGTQAATITITCNGTAAACNLSPSSRTYACLHSNPTSFTTAGFNGAACTSGSNAGYYVTIHATYRYKPAIFTNPWLNNKAITQDVTVRVI